jgi:hypothetical protein
VCNLCERKWCCSFRYWCPWLQRQTVYHTRLYSTPHRLWGPPSPVGIGGPSFRVQLRWHEDTHSPVPSVEVNNVWRFTSTPPYICMTWYLVTQYGHFCLKSLSELWLIKWQALQLLKVLDFWSALTSDTIKHSQTHEWHNKSWKVKDFTAFIPTVYVLWTRFKLILKKQRWRVRDRFRLLKLEASYYYQHNNGCSLPAARLLASQEYLCFME